MEVRSPRPTLGPPAQESIGRKISHHNFWLQKPAGIESVEEAAGALSSSLGEPKHGLSYSDSLTSSELQHWVAA